MEGDHGRGQDRNNISPNITCSSVLTEIVKYLKYLKLKWNWKGKFNGKKFLKVGSQMKKMYPLFKLLTYCMEKITKCFLEHRFGLAYLMVCILKTRTTFKCISKIYCC